MSPGAYTAGPVKDESKWHLIASSAILVLPSHGENFGLTVAEALACGVPVVATTCTPWKTLLHHRCGWWVAPGPESLTAGLREALSTPDDIFIQMGARGRDLVAREFSWTRVVKSMVEVYEWVTMNGPEPSAIWRPRR